MCHAVIGFVSPWRQTALSTAQVSKRSVAQALLDTVNFV